MTTLIDIEEIETMEGLEKIRGEWDGLLETCSGATPFQHPEWLIALWRHLGEGHLIALAMRAAGRLCGIAPLYENKGEVRFIGNGISDYLGLILDRSVELVGTKAVLEHMASREGWSTLRLEELRPSSALLSVSPPAGLKAEHLPGEVCLRATLPETVGAFSYTSGMPGGGRSKRTRRRFAARGRGLHIETAVGQDEVNSFLGTLFFLHAKKWESAGVEGVLQGPERMAFHEEAAAGFMKKNMLRLYRLVLDGRPLAALYGFAFRSTFYAYVMGYDPDFARMSPGRRMLISAAQDCIEKGIANLDFLRGAEKYKYRWSPEETRNSTLVITR